MTARSRSGMAFGNYFDFIGYRVLRPQLPCRCARDFTMTFAIINLGRQLDSRTTALYNVTTFSTLVMGIGELGAALEARSSCASEKTSSSSASEPPFAIQP